MTQTRRDFIKAFAAALAAAIGAGLLPGCTPRSATVRSTATAAPTATEPPYIATTCYLVAATPDVPVATAAPHPAWAALRRAWIDVGRCKTLDEIQRQRIVQLAALRELVEAGTLDTAVANEMERAFEEATLYYNGMGMMLPTCYTPTPPPRPTEVGCYVAPTPEACYESPELLRLHWALAQQAKTLAEMSDAGKLDPASVAKVQIALGQDIALFELIAACDTLPPGEHLAAEDRLVKQFDAGALDATPEAIQAARYLVALFTGGALP